MVTSGKLWAASTHSVVRKTPLPKCTKLPEGKNPYLFALKVLGYELGKFHKVIFTALTVLAISMSSLVVGAPAAEAAPTSMPTCNKVLSKLPGKKYDGHRSLCHARTLWVAINAAAKGAAKVPDDAGRAKINAKYYWAVAGPILDEEAFAWGWFADGKWDTERKSGADDSKEYLRKLRDYVALHKRNYRHMKSSVLMLEAITKLEKGKNLRKKVSTATRNAVFYGLTDSNTSGMDVPMAIIVADKIPLVTTSYAEDSRTALTNILH